MKFSVIISTIGCPFVVDCVRSMREQFDEVRLVFDMVGRACSNLDAEYPLAKLISELPIGVHLDYYNAAPGRWAVQNGCYNYGARMAQSDWLLFTHDDVMWPDYNFVPMISEQLTAIERHGDPNIVGLILPEREVVNQADVPAFETTTPVLTYTISPVSQVLSRGAFNAFGGFDEDYGVWYDGQLEQETILRDWWYVSLPTPRLQHTSNRTYQANNWGNAWAAAPKWGRHVENFVRKYGVAPTSRRLDGKTLPLPW